MHVAVCIVGFRNLHDITECLAALAVSTHTDFEVVICENGGPEAFAALVAAVPQRLAGGQPVRLIDARSNLGYAGGVNLCMAATPEADAWWVLNPDAVPYPEALERLSARLAKGGCAAVGGTIHDASGHVRSRGGVWNAWLARAVSLDDALTLDDPLGAVAAQERLNYISGASMLVGREFLERVGPMREDYFLYCEEVEWCLRGVQAGLTFGIAPEAYVLHDQGTSTGSALDVRDRGRMPVYLDERNKVLVTRDRYPGRLVVAASASFALLFLRFGRRGAWAQLGYALSGWWAGVRDERGPPPWISV
ncbi:MAG: glycosyltransferase family 2 protein [Phenylobacterium sp.]